MATMAPSPTTLTATEPPTDASNAASSAKGSSSQSTQSSGTIAGIVVGCALLVALIIGGFFYSGRAKGKDPSQVWQEWLVRSQALKADQPNDGVALASFGTDNVNVDSNSSRGSDFDHSQVYLAPSRGARDLSPTFVPYVAHRDSRRPSGFSPQTYGGMPPPPPGRRASASPANRGTGYL